MSTEYGALNGVSWGSIGDGGQPILETGVTIPVVEREKTRAANHTSHAYNLLIRHD